MSLRKPSFFLCVAALLAACPTSHGTEPTRVVATGGRIASSFYEPASGNNAFRHRTPHKLGGPVAEIQIGIMDWMYPYQAETPNATNDVTIEHAWLERESTGEVLPLTFSTSRQLVLPMNSTTAYWLADPIPASAWSGGTLSRDEVFWLNLHGSIPEGGKIPVGTPATYSGAKFIVYPPANDPGTYDTTGPVPSITGSTSRTAGLPMVFLGRFTEPGHLSVIGIGDSILDGSGDSVSTLPTISGFGFFNRAAVDSNGENAIAMFNLTRHGQSAYSFVTPTRQTRQSQFLPFANVVVEEYGTNDLGSAGTGDAAEILERTETIWEMARAAGVQKVIRTKLMPRTSSTDSWSTLAGQTPNTGWEDGTKRDTINAGFEAALSAGKIDLLIDSLATLADPSDDNRWFTNGSAKYVSGDGTHLSPSGNALFAPVLRSALLSLTVDGSGETSFSDWSDGIEWNGADSSPLGDPNFDGITNLVCYSTGADPLNAAAAADKLPTCKIIPDGGENWLTFSYRARNDAPDLTCFVVSSETLSGWSELEPDGSSITIETLDSDVDGDGSFALYQVKVNLAIHTEIRFLRLQVEH